MEEKWYVVRVQANRERSLSEKILKYSTDGELVGKISQVISPVDISFTVRNGKKIKREKALYPGYVFIKTGMVAEMKNYFKSVEGVSGFLSNRSGEPQSLTDSEVSKMIGDQEIEINKVSPFMVGEAVTIIDGPFATFKGKIEKVEGDRIKVDVKIFGRVTPVDLSSIQIVKDY